MAKGKDKGKEKANELFPPVYIGEGLMRFDANEELRAIFLRGYEFGLNSTFLSWMDLKLLVKLADRLLPDNGFEADTFEKQFPTEQSYYEAVLKEFVRIKNKNTNGNS